MTESERLQHSMRHMTFACPECDKAGSIFIRQNENSYAGDPDDEYYCGRCRSTFDEPVERQDKRFGGKRA